MEQNTLLHHLLIWARNCIDYRKGHWAIQSAGPRGKSGRFTTQCPRNRTRYRSREVARIFVRSAAEIARAISGVHLMVIGRDILSCRELIQSVRAGEIRPWPLVCALARHARCYVARGYKSNRRTLKYFCINHGDQRAFLFEVIVCLNYSSFRFIRIMGLRSPYIIMFHSFSAVIVFRRQNLTSVDVRFWRL